MASWARYAEGIDEQGNTIQVVDRLKEPLRAAAARQREEPLAFVSNRQIFGDLAANELFVRAYTEALIKLHKGGARATLKSLTSQP